MTQTIETIPGRSGLEVPVISIKDTYMPASVFPQFFQALDRLNGLGLYEGNEVYIPPEPSTTTSRLRPALLLRHARESLPQDLIDRNRQNAQPGPDDWGQYGEYTFGHEQFTVSAIPDTVGPIEELVSVQKELRSQEVVFGAPIRRPETPSTVLWRGKDMHDLFTEQESSLWPSEAYYSALSRYFRKTVKLFTA